MPSETGHLESLEAKAPILFLVGGALYAVFVANSVLTTYTGTSFSEANTFAQIGKAFIMVGTIGLFPTLATERPYLARAAAVVAAIPAIGWAFVGMVGIAEAVGLISGHPDPAFVPFVLLITKNLAFVLFGVTVLATDIHPKVIGVLLLVWASLLPLWMTVLSGVPIFVGDIIGLLVTLGVGVALLKADIPATRSETPAEPTA